MWKLRVDLDRLLKFLAEISVTRHLPMVHHSRDSDHSTDHCPMEGISS